MEIVNKLNLLQGNATFDTVSEMLFSIDDSITIKKFKDNDELFLVHNDFNKDNNDTLYKECRSFVMAIKDGNAKIVSYSHENISEETPKDDNVEMQEAFEGTLITMFYYDRWRFVTSRCTDIDSSFFYNSKITFGNMFDDCLRNMNTDRVLFANQFGSFDHIYSFVLVHHENKYIKDYTDRYGENYTKLVLVGDRDDMLVPCTLKSYPGIELPQTIINDDVDCVIYKVFDESRQTYKYYKKLSDNYQLAIKRKPNFSNVWYSYFQIFINNEKEFTIDMFRKENNITDEYTLNNNKINITGMIYLLYRESASLLMNLVMHFTKFEGNTFTKINSEDYEKMNSHVFNNIKKQIATLQSLIRIGTIHNTNGIVTHLRKHVSVYQFVHVLKGIQALNNYDFCEITDEYYENYLNFLINQLNS